MQARLKARWIFPVDRPPIENGVVEIAGGIIVDVRQARPHEVAEDLGDVAILPGLINAHAHLEFNLVAKPFDPPLPFTSWIRSLMAYRREAFGADTALKVAAIAAGWREAAASGTTLIGEIATDDWSLDAMHLRSHHAPRDERDASSRFISAENRRLSGATGSSRGAMTATYAAGPRVVAFRELIGLRAETVARQEAIAEEWLASFNGTSNIAAAISPHAPYSVSPMLLTRAVSLAQQHNAPVAMHLAETRAELEFLASGRGEFVDMLRGFGAIPDEGLPTGLRPLDILRALADAPRALVVHGNYLVDDEIDFLAARPQMSVVYCPRTHQFFGHEPHPWRRLLTQGVNVAIGTDGRGSNPDLSVWNELTFLRSRFPDVAPQTLLEMGTLAGARSLGFDADCGSLTLGKRADLVVVSVNGSVAVDDPQELLFVAGQQILATRFARLTPTPSAWARTPMA